MSYVIHLWKDPIPNNYEEAESFVFDEPRKENMDSSIFQELAVQLTEKYPCSCGDDDQSDDEVWSDGPLDGRCSENIYAIGILSQFADEVLPFVIEKASDLGLTIYDMQVGRSIIPSGEVLLLTR